MTAELRVYDASTYTNNGVQQSTGSLTDPIKAVEITGDYSHSKMLKIPKAASGVVPTLLWDWTQQPDFEFVRVSLLGAAGYLELYWKVDSPTSSSDATPSGNAPNCHQKDLGCHTPEFFNTDEAKVHATLTTAGGFDGDGYPAMATDAGKLTGKIYSLWAYNPSTTTDYYAEIAVRN